MPHYDKAPIKEALIDIRVQLPPDVRFENLQAIKGLVNDYPKQETRHLGEGTFHFGPEARAVAQQKPWGLIYRNEHNTQVAQFRLDGFTFSRLEPYQDWEHLRDEARRLWDMYRDAVKPTAVTRVALRYINVFNFSDESVEPEQYLNVFPQVTEKLPPELRDYGPFWLNLNMHQDDLKGVLIINEGTTVPTEPAIIAIALDFDLFVESPPVLGEQDLWTFFEKMRSRKNQYFEACITDKTRELIS
jgi:uncharacterized protein (TIGR04255 family)